MDPQQIIVTPDHPAYDALASMLDPKAVAERFATSEAGAQHDEDL